ncbi:MFS transporter [Saccharopolyspora taberi]|uniref:MFS transporter n=1 Tax=Saccharopolyspora taberi TaxID=60895 RepID=A0ABN3VAQ3_9PSEU
MRGAAAITTFVATTAFVTTLDNTIIAAAAPSIGRELGLGLPVLQWVSLAYMLPYAGLLLPAGALLDRLGRRRLLLTGCAVLVAGSLLGGVARSAEGLLLARAVQGTAAAFLVPGALSLVRTALPERRRPLAVAIWTGALAVALALGPWLGGALAEHLHWSWVFFSNLPFAAVASLSLIAAAAPEPPRPARARLVMTPVLAWSNVLILLWGLGISGIAFFTPLLHQDFLGMAPDAAGLPLGLVAVAVACATPFVPLATRGLGPHGTVCLGFSVVALGLVALAVVNHQPALAPRLAGLALIGAGSAFTTPITTYALDLTGEDVSGTASGVLSTSRELSSALGVALIGFVLSRVRAGELAAGVDGGTALSTGYTAALVVAAVLQAAGAGIALLVLRPPRVRSGRGPLLDHAARL